MRGKCLQFCALAAVASAVFPAAAAEDGDSSAAARHGIARAIPILLPCAVNPVSRFDKNGEDAIIATALTPYADRRIYLVTLGEATNLVTRSLNDPSDRARPVFQHSVVAFKDDAGKALYSIETRQSDALQRVAFLRANFDAQPDMSEVLFVTANRIGGNAGSPTPVDIMVYRLHVDPIIDGEIVYFAPASSWQTAGSYSTATAALGKVFGVELTPDGGDACNP